MLWNLYVFLHISVSMADVSRLIQLSYTPVFIIGNGPSALTLSAALGGNLPRLQPDMGHPFVAIQNRLEKIPASRPIIDIDLGKLAEGVAGRCVNPTAAFVDEMRFPGVDSLGSVHSALLETSLHEDRIVYHVVMGISKPGGSWHHMTDTFLSLSPAEWMSLPGFTMEEYMQTSGSPSSYAAQDRLPRSIVAGYYEAYAHRFSPTRMFQGRVTRIEPPPRAGDAWTIQWSCDAHGVNGTTQSHAVVLAVGTTDIPQKLMIPGEDLPFVSHRCLSPPTTGHDLVLVVVGAGLSAADTIVAWLDRGHSVIHIVRGEVASTPIVRMFRHPSSMYPAEHKLAKLMLGEYREPRYTIMSRANLESINQDATRRELHASGHLCQVVLDDGPSVSQICTHVAILIGSSPDLSFLPESVRQLLPAEAHNEPKPLRTNGSPSPHPLHVPVNPATFEVQMGEHGQGLYAMGSLRGDNFVRYVVGDAYGIARHISMSMHST